MRAVVQLLLGAALAVSCSESPARDSGAFEDVAPLDAYVADSGADDALAPDGDAVDAAPNDADVTDAGVMDADPDAGSPPGTRLRIMAANLTSGNFQTYDPGEGIRIIRGLNPDIVLIQEFNYGTDTEADLRVMVDSAMGMGAFFYRGETGSIPNGVISRYPILDQGTWADAEVGNRGFSWAQIDIPGDVDLWAVSLHLLTSNAGTRNREAMQLVDYIQVNIPENDYLVVGGDLNTDVREEVAVMTLEAVVSAQITPVDQDGNDNTNAPRSRPYDWVLPDLDLEALHTSVIIGAQAFPDGLVFDSRTFTPLTEVAPVQQGDSEANQMQHMAVVKDYLVP